MGKMQAVQEMINVFVASVVSLAVLFILTRLGGKTADCPDELV